MIAKRVLDVVLALVAILLLAPMLFLIAVLLKLRTGSPVLFSQERVGRYGHKFWIHKFRTMQVDAAAVGPPITVGEDPRVTSVGRYLRKYKLDELPQFFDVLVGNMSLVGPRPELPRYVELYPDAIRDKVLSVPPGITDLASLEFIDENLLLAGSSDPQRDYIEKILPLKLRYCVEYVEQRSLWYDVKILLRTAGNLARR